MEHSRRERFAPGAIWRFRSRSADRVFVDVFDAVGPLGEALLLSSVVFAQRHFQEQDRGPSYTARASRAPWR
jgi:hypothetical protein